MNNITSNITSINREHDILISTLILCLFMFIMILFCSYIIIYSLFTVYNYLINLEFENEYILIFNVIFNTVSTPALSNFCCNILMKSNQNQILNDSSIV